VKKLSTVYLLDEDEVILTLCALVDLIFIPERKKMQLMWRIQRKGG